jgi:type III restriction enzyme
VLALTVQRRNALAKSAEAWGAESGRFIRPVALIQAQPRNKNRETHTADKVKAALIEQLGVSAERIRIVTGETDELGDDDLSSPGCQVEYVITVEKLREGWDCPFAYVLGSVGNVATETAVEQLLGRILRMPNATPTGVPELDRAYAIVQSEDVARTAQNLADSMVNRCGFDRENVNDVFRVHRHRDPQAMLAVATIPVSTAPDLSQLPAATRAKLKYEATTGTISIHGSLTRDETQVLRDSLTTDSDRDSVDAYWQESREVGTAHKNLNEYAKPFSLPQLAIRD